MTGMSVIWNVLGWGLVGLAALALLLALLGDVVRRRFRRVRRCPKCWYDLSHTPGMTCSECGHTAKRERQLFKTRRRKRWVLAALLVWLGSYFAFRVPAMQQRGWVAAVPTTALVIIAPRLKPSCPGGFQAQREALAKEIGHRAAVDALGDWHWQLLIRGALREGHRPFARTYQFGEVFDNSCLLLLSSSDAEGRLIRPEQRLRANRLAGLRITTRPQWPVGSTVMLRVDPAPCFGYSTMALRLLLIDPPVEGAIYHAGPTAPGEPSDTTWSPMAWKEPTVPLNVRSVEGQRFVLRLEGERPIDELWSRSTALSRLAWSYDIPIRTRIAGTIDDILVPVQSKEFEESLISRGVFQPVGNHLWIRRLEECLKLLDGATFAATIELLDGDAVIASARTWWALTPILERELSLRDVQLDLTLERPIPDSLSNSKALQLRIRSDPELALRRFDCDRFWSGEITMPVEWVAPSYEAPNPRQGSNPAHDQ